MGKSSEQHLQMRDDEVNGVPMYNSAPKTGKIERVLLLLNHDIAWAAEEKSNLIDPSDGTQEAWFDGYMLAINLAKKRIKDNL